MTDKFSLLAGIAADWWWEMDAELRFTFLSERFVEIFGLPPSSALGRLCTEVVPADDNDPAWRAHLDDLAHVHHRHAMTDALDDGHVVGNEQEGQPHLLLEIKQQIDDENARSLLALLVYLLY